MTKSFRFTLVWIIGAFFAVLMSMNPLSAAFVDGHYIPVGNDSFYHARRILDTVADPNSFYEFDDKIHAPEGSLLVWPWAYDYVMAGIVRGILHTGLADDPMKVLAYLPVAAIVLSVGLVVGIAITLEVSWFGALLLALSVAFSSLTQTLHGVGNIDHHFAEYIFVLAALFLGLKWLCTAESKLWAACTGAVLGIAPAFQNGLFILQVPLLITVAALWVHSIRLPKTSVYVFTAALIAGTLAAVIPSQPFRQGIFEFYFLSWFHLYVACCTAAVVLAMAFLTPSLRAAFGIFALAALAAIPLLSQAVTGTAFVAGSLGMLPDIAETHGVLRLAAGRGMSWIFEFYSFFICLAPLAIIGCVFLMLKDRTNRQIAFMSVFCISGLLLLMMQFRFHVYGSLALVLPWVVFSDRVGTASARKRLITCTALTFAMLAAYVPSIRDQLFERKVPGNDTYYALTHSIYPSISEACRSRPGVILAGSDAGHYLRFHTECSVIANNFLITPQHFAKFQEVKRLMSLSPAELLQSASDINYVYVSLADVASVNPGKDIVRVTPETLSEVQPRLVATLLFSDPASIDPRLRLVKELRFSDSLPIARLFEIVPSSTQSTAPP